MKKKLFKDKIFGILIIVLTGISMLPLIFLVAMVIENGISSINWSFITSIPKPPGEEGGGVLNGIIGTFMLIIIASLIAIPLGIFIGLFLYEFREKTFGRFCSTLVNTLYGIPSIVVGIIAYLWLVRSMGHFSALSGGVALSLIFLPMVIKTTEETLKMLPFSLVEASLALGASYSKTVFKVLLPCAINGILSGILSGIARISGETAPLLFTAFGNPFTNLNILKPVSSLPHIIFTFAISPYEEWRKQAYGAALILILFVFGFSFLSKYITRKWRSHLG